MKTYCTQFVLLAFIAFVVSANVNTSWAQSQMPNADASEFSLTPSQPCKVPPTAPPDSLLRRKYKVQNLTVNIHQLDLNGDGICDWLREGFEATTRDLENERNLEWDKFIFLGTPTGWRRIKALNQRDYRAMPPSTFWRSTSLAMPIAAAVYQKGKLSPYLVAFNPPERTSTGDLGWSFIGAWDGGYESYKEVGDQTRDKIQQYLAKTLCRDGPDPEAAVKDLKWSYARMMVTPQNDGLCPRK